MYPDAALTTFAAMDDATFEMCIMPAAITLMKKTRKTAHTEMTAEEKAAKILKMKLEWLDSEQPDDFTDADELMDEMEIVPTPPTNIVFYTDEEWKAIGKVEQKKKTKDMSGRPINETKSDMEAYQQYAKSYSIVKTKITRAAFAMFESAYDKKKFTIGNYKINAAGNMVKAGGKAEVSEAELACEIKVDGKTYDLQKNTEEAETGKELRVPENMMRMKKCGADSKQVAILPYTTPYHPTDECGCSAPVMIKDITDFMVKKIGDNEYEKVSGADAMKCAPCFRRCNADTSKGANGFCARHTKTANKPRSARVENVAAANGFHLGDVWTSSNTDWYNKFNVE